MEHILTALEPLIVAGLPLVITWIMSMIKHLPVFNVDDALRPIVLRLATAVLALVSAVIIGVLGGDPVNEMHVNELVYAVVAFLGATGGHELFKKK